MTQYDPLTLLNNHSFYERMPDYQFRILICGDVGSGRLSLMQRQVKNEFSDNYTTNCEIELNSKIEINDKLISLKLIRGESKNIPQINRMRGCHAYIVTIDMTDRDTLSHAEMHLANIMKFEKFNKSYHSIFLVGTKNDNIIRQTVDLNELISLYEKWMLDDYVITSAKENKNVDEMFKKIGECILFKVQAQETANSIEINSPLAPEITSKCIIS